MKSTKTIHKYPQPDLNQGCLDWKAGVLTTTPTVLADRDIAFIHEGKRALFTVATEECLCQVQICKQKVLIKMCMIACLFVTKEQNFLICERDSRREWGNLHSGVK